MADPVFVGGTGHRLLPPAHIPWIEGRTRAGAVWLAGRGFTDGICGMADGWDLIWGDAVVRAGMRLWAAIPFPEQPQRFRRPADRDEWRRLRDLAGDRVWEGPSLGTLAGRDRARRANQLLWQRNLKIVTPASYLVCCWDPNKVEHCGTCNAIRAARARGLTAGLNIDPSVCAVRMRLPDPRT